MNIYMASLSKNLQLKIYDSQLEKSIAWLIISSRTHAHNHINTQISRDLILTRHKF